MYTARGEDNVVFVKLFFNEKFIGSFPSTIIGDRRVVWFTGKYIPVTLPNINISHLTNEK